MAEAQESPENVGANAAVCNPDAACLLLKCNPTRPYAQCDKGAEISALRRNLRSSGHVIGEMHIRCRKCGGINGHNGDCENRFGIRINTLDYKPCPKLGKCSATNVSRSLPRDECTLNASLNCSFF